MSLCGAGFVLDGALLRCDRSDDGHTLHMTTVAINGRECATGWRDGDPGALSDRCESCGNGLAEADRGWLCRRCSVKGSA